jgi:hypothetical protein
MVKPPTPSGALPASPLMSPIALPTAPAPPTPPAGAGPAAEREKPVAPMGNRGSFLRKFNLCGKTDTPVPAAPELPHDAIITGSQLQQFAVLLENEATAREKMIKSFLKKVGRLDPEDRKASAAQRAAGPVDSISAATDIGGKACLAAFMRRPKSKAQQVQELIAQTRELLPTSQPDLSLANAAVILRAFLKTQLQPAIAFLRTEAGLVPLRGTAERLEQPYEELYGLLKDPQGAMSFGAKAKNARAPTGYVAPKDSASVVEQLLGDAEKSVPAAAREAWINFLLQINAVPVEEAAVKSEEGLTMRQAGKAPVVQAAGSGAAEGKVTAFDFLELQHIGHKLAFTHPGSGVIRNAADGDCLLHALEGPAARANTRSGPVTEASLRADEVLEIRQKLARQREEMADSSTNNAHQVAMALASVPWIYKEQAAVLVTGRHRVPNHVYAALQKVPGIHAGEDELVQWCRLKSAESAEHVRVLVVDTQGALLWFDQTGGQPIPVTAEDKEAKLNEALAEARQGNHIALFRSGDHWEQYKNNAPTA